MESKAFPLEVVEVTDDDNNDILYDAPKPSPESVKASGTNIRDAISVERYCQSISPQLYGSSAAASAASSTSSRTNKLISFIDIDDDDDDDDIQVIELFTPPSSSLNRRTKNTNKIPIWENTVSIIEIGESSNSNSSNNEMGDDQVRTFVCEICVEPKPNSDSFPIMGCAHSYCTDCVRKYVASKLQENITQIQCPVPRCFGLLEPEHCRSILSHEVFDRWGDALCEAVILAPHKFYCPFRDCSALLINDDNNENNGMIVVQSECPYCRRLFCAQCKVPWHTGIECREFQNLHEDERETEDIMVMNLAKNRGWTRCPNCRIYVEKTMGCDSVVCRCGHNFMYNNGHPRQLPGVHNHQGHRNPHAYPQALDILAHIRSQPQVQRQAQGPYGPDILTHIESVSQSQSQVQPHIQAHNILDPPMYIQSQPQPRLQVYTPGHNGFDPSPFIQSESESQSQLQPHTQGPNMREPLSMREYINPMMMRLRDIRNAMQNATNPRNANDGT